MEITKTGDLIFSTYQPDKNISSFYKFNKKNYEAHCLKHYISDKKSLQYIENAIQNPDCATSGKNPNQFNFYLVMSYQKYKTSIVVKIYKIICYKHYQKGNKIFYKIATAINQCTTNYNAINSLENIIWKKPNSLI